MQAFTLHDEALEVLGLRHTGEDGMVGALATLFDQANVSFSVTGREANAVPEICSDGKKRFPVSFLFHVLPEESFR